MEHTLSSDEWGCHLVRAVRKHCQTAAGQDTPEATTEHMYTFSESNLSKLKELRDLVSPPKEPADKKLAQEKEDMLVDFDTGAEAIILDSDEDIEKTFRATQDVPSTQSVFSTQKQRNVFRSQRLDGTFVSQRTRKRFLSEPEQVHSQKMSPGVLAAAAFDQSFWAV